MKALGYIFIVIAMVALVSAFMGATHQIFMAAVFGILATSSFTTKESKNEKSR